jgi:hypothetical protein
MVSKAKLYSQLDRMEEELRERIVPHLENAAIGENDLVFCATDFNPFSQLKFRTDAETDSLIQLGGQILALRNKLGEPSEGSIAERICWYCEKWGDTGDSHRKAAAGLAREFLQEIVNAGAKT